MAMKIIHISDSHFGNDKPVFELNLLSKAFLDFKHLFSNDDTYLIVSGDITLKGNEKGYHEASNFFRKIWVENGGSRNRFFACPGNHDFCNSTFEAFDVFVAGIRQDNLLNFSKSATNIVEAPDATFLLVNSTAHGDTTFGCIDINNLREKLKNELTAHPSLKQRIAVVHHNVFGIYKTDSSAIRNSLAFVSLLDEYKFNVILHGHQHSQMVVKVGENRMQIFAGRSLNYQTTGIVNGMAVLTFNGSVWERENKVLSHDHSSTQQLRFNEA